MRGDWRSSSERRKIFGACVAAILLPIGTTIAGVFLGHAAGGSAEYNREASLLFGAIGFGLGVYFGVLGALLYRSQQHRAWYDRVVVLRAKRDLDAVEKAVADADDLTLNSLWTVTQKRLDYYHRIATGQSEKSFTYGLVAAAVGLSVIVITAAASALAHNAAGSAAAGVVGLAASGISAYLGATFIRLQETTTKQLRAYFSQPLELSRYLAAERLLGSLDATNREQALQHLIRSIAANGREGTSESDLT